MSDIKEQMKARFGEHFAVGPVESEQHGKLQQYLKDMPIWNPAPHSTISIYWPLERRYELIFKDKTYSYTIIPVPDFLSWAESLNAPDIHDGSKTSWIDADEKMQAPTWHVGQRVWDEVNFPGMDGTVEVLDNKGLLVKFLQGPDNRLFYEMPYDWDGVKDGFAQEWLKENVTPTLKPHPYRVTFEPVEDLPKPGTLVYAWDKVTPDLVVIGYFVEKFEGRFFVQRGDEGRGLYDHISTENPFPPFVELV
jgi:hypothetical protein